MNKITLLGLSAAVAIATALPAAAADLRPAPMPAKAPVLVAAPFSWSGCYIGVHGGGARGDKRWYNAAGVEFIDRAHDADGFLVGGQVGCNWQQGQFVFGIEGEAAWANIDGSASVAGLTTTTYNTEADILGSIAGRIGWAFDRTLLFVKGGAAFTHERQWIATTGGTTFDMDRDLRWGWLVGGGLEYAFAPNWSGKIEYNYMNFGTADISLCAVPTGACFSDQIKQDMHVVKVGVNYRWGGGSSGY